MRLLQIKELLQYEAVSGFFFVLKDALPYRRIFPTDEGYLLFSVHDKRYKIKANKAAIVLGWNKDIEDDKVVLHMNFDQSDYRLSNLRVISRKAKNQVKEAMRNLNKYLKIQMHETDAYKYVIRWKENGQNRSTIVQDIILAKKILTKLQLKFSKIISKYCLFE